MSKQRHCDRSGCDSLEPCNNSGFYVLRGGFGTRHFCSYECLSAYASGEIRRSQQSSREFRAAMERLSPKPDLELSQ